MRVVVGEMTNSGNCRICGETDCGLLFSDWVRPTFNDWDKLQEGTIICNACLFWFDERSEDLAQIVGKKKPQRMRNYSHFIIGGEWIPLNKGDKERMQTFLLSMPFPEFAIIAESGQKHIAFRTRRNEIGGMSGWVQFEEKAIYVDPLNLKSLLNDIENLYITFNKAEIRTGRYISHRVLKFGIERWDKIESRIKQKRGSPLFNLALFLAQRKQKGKDERATRNGSRSTDSDLERNPSGLQEPLPTDDLATVRGSGSVGIIHEQPGQVRQLTLFETPG
jgi:hypothetical protein